MMVMMMLWNLDSRLHARYPHPHSAVVIRADPTLQALYLGNFGRTVLNLGLLSVPPPHARLPAYAFGGSSDLVANHLGLMQSPLIKGKANMTLTATP